MLHAMPRHATPGQIPCPSPIPVYRIPVSIPVTANMYEYTTIIQRNAIQQTTAQQDAAPGSKRHSRAHARGLLSGGGAVGVVGMATARAARPTSGRRRRGAGGGASAVILSSARDVTRSAGGDVRTRSQPSAQTVCFAVDVLVLLATWEQF